MFCLVGGLWSVFHLVGGRWFLWSVRAVVGGRCFAFLLVGGRFLFSRMVGGRCLSQYMVGGRWLMVGGRSVVGGFVLRSNSYQPLKVLISNVDSMAIEPHFDSTTSIF